MNATFNLALIVAFIFWATNARANFIGNDTSNFNPLPSGSDFVTVHNSQTLAPGYLSFGLFFNEAVNSFPDTRDQFGNVQSADGNIQVADFGVAMGLARNFEIATSFSYLVQQDINRDLPGGQFADNGLNEIKFLAKYRVPFESRFGFAVVASININQTANNPFIGDGGGPGANLELVADTRLNNMAFAANVGYRFRHKGDPIPNSVYDPIGDQIIASVATNYDFNQWNTKWILEVFASKLTESTRYVSSEDISSEALTGLRYATHRFGTYHVGVGSRITEGLFTPDFRVYAGVIYSFDLFHFQQPPVAALLPPPATLPVAEKVVMPPPPPEVRIEYRDGYTPRDIATLAGASFDEISRTHEFRLKTKIQEQDIQSSKPPFEIVRLENFDFDFGSAKIQERYYPLLDQVAAYVAEKPQPLKIRVEGHTDSIGSEERNRLRSQQRADEVKKYLQNTGRFSHLQVEAVGFGAQRPISDNSTELGRKQNRRVEIRVLRSLE